MAGYSALKITGMQTGLVQNREEFILPNDAYPTLQNAYVWRERILRKKGYELLGRLQRQEAVTGNLTGGAFNIITGLSLEVTASIVIGSINVIDQVQGTTYTDPLMNGMLTATGGTGTGGTINYATGELTINLGAGDSLGGTIEYYPGLPVMGIRIEEVQNSANDTTIFFDQVYAYKYNQMTMAFEEFTIAGTTWNAKGAPVSSTDFFWSTNYWVSSNPPWDSINVKLFWVTNNTGQYQALADPIRITDGAVWVNFQPPTYGQIDSTNFLVQCLSFLPFRGRLLCFNTWEGTGLANSTNYTNRIRWSTIGNPFIPYFNSPPQPPPPAPLVPPSTGSWRDDIRGQGGFLDIPTSEDIVSVGFVRDNLVIYCERSTWQLRYTGRSISPFQIERVNSELGGEGPFSAVQFDTSLVGIGDKGIVECDSYKSERIDIKIPDFVFAFQPGTGTDIGQNNAPFRVHGVRDFINRLAYWTIPLASAYQSTLDSTDQIFPNTRLVYNYENDSWALFSDSLTTLGTYQPQASRTWLNTKIPWIKCNFSWKTSQAAQIPAIVGGNQQGFIEYLNKITTNDVSLYIAAITPNGITPTTGTATVITSPNHNMSTGFVIGISGIPTGTPYANLNGGIFGITILTVNTFALYLYNSSKDAFNIPQIDVSAGAYVGGGLINIRENFSVLSKKFNFLDEGKNIQMGYLDILMKSTEQEEPGAISLNVYLNYDGNLVSNTTPQNEINDYSPIKNPDTFFNSVIPTTQSTTSGVAGSKFWQRVYCPTQGNFLTINYLFSNAQMAGLEQETEVQIDAQVLWIRKSGRMTQ